MKILLGVSVSTPNTVVFGKRGRFPLFIKCVVRCIKFWWHVIHLSKTKLPRGLLHANREVILVVVGCNIGVVIADVRAAVGSPHWLEEPPHLPHWPLPAGATRV